ncbi:MAG: hydrogenase maturation protease [Anaerolineales bacterium]|jgi:hydrogenase maturation protease
MRLLVLGIGHELRGDDGAGPQAVRCWQQQHPAVLHDPIIDILLMETPGLELLDYLEGADAAVLVDAVTSGKPPGTVQVFDPFPESRPSAGEKTAHGFGIAESIALARTAGKRLPDVLILIGIEVSQVALGSNLSEPVRLAMPQAVKAIQQAVESAASAGSMPSAQTGI